MNCNHCGDVTQADVNTCPGFCELRDKPATMFGYPTDAPTHRRKSDGPCEASLNGEPCLLTGAHDEHKSAHGEIYAVLGRGIRSQHR